LPFPVKAAAIGLAFARGAIEEVKTTALMTLRLASRF
jgi:hypothetical protein